MCKCYNNPQNISRLTYFKRLLRPYSPSRERRSDTQLVSHHRWLHPDHVRHWLPLPNTVRRQSRSSQAHALGFCWSRSLHDDDCHSALIRWNVCPEGHEQCSCCILLHLHAQYVASLLGTMLSANNLQFSAHQSTVSHGATSQKSCHFTPVQRVQP